MKIESNTEETVQQLVAIGYSLSDSTQVSTGHFAKYDWLNRQSPQFWYATADELSTNDLKALIKALTFVESKFQWTAGSVSSVIWLFKVYERRVNNSEELANWILANTRNPYLPFGSYNFSTVSMEEYLTARDNYYQYKRLNREKCIKEQEDARELKLQRRQLAIERKQKKKEESADRNDFLRWFNNPSRAEQLKVIAGDAVKPVDYYPAECAVTDEDILRQLNEEEQGLLIGRLQNRRKGPWQKTLIKLLELTSRHE